MEHHCREELGRNDETRLRPLLVAIGLFVFKGYTFHQWFDLVAVSEAETRCAGCTAALKQVRTLL